MQNAENLPFDKSLKMFIYFRIVHFFVLIPHSRSLFSILYLRYFLLLARATLCDCLEIAYWMVYTAYTHLASDYQITVG